MTAPDATNACWTFTRHAIGFPAVVVIGSLALAPAPGLADLFVLLCGVVWLRGILRTGRSARPLRIAAARVFGLAAFLAAAWLSPPPERDFDDIAEVVVRRQLAHLEGTDVRLCFVGMSGRDPAPGLLARFTGSGVRVRPLSEADVVEDLDRSGALWRLRDGAGVFDRSTRERGVVLEIRVVRRWRGWEAVVEASAYASGVEGNLMEYTVGWVWGRWRLTGERCIAVA